MVRVVRSIVASTFSILIALTPVVAQQSQNPDPTAPIAPQKLTKEQKKKMGRALKELDAQYKQWLNEDVVYIISPEERTAFLQLSTNEEREQFIEQFWLRRSSNPDLPENDFKEEHYRRIAYANEHYASGIPGWRTDRGRTVHHVGTAGRSGFASDGRHVRPADGRRRRFDDDLSLGNVALPLSGRHWRKRISWNSWIRAGRANIT